MACQREYFHYSMDLVDDARTWLSQEDEDDFDNGGAEVKLETPTRDTGVFNALVSVYSAWKLLDESDVLNASEDYLIVWGRVASLNSTSTCPNKTSCESCFRKPIPKTSLNGVRSSDRDRDWVGQVDLITSYGSAKWQPTSRPAQMGRR